MKGVSAVEEKAIMLKIATTPLATSLKENQ